MESHIQDRYVVQTTYGPISGYVDMIDNKSYYKFKSIPYAKPPLGKLRFLPPQHIQPWEEVKDCTKQTPYVISFNKILNSISGSEDCLYLEISTPNVTPAKPMPVMFWVGGYGFQTNIDRAMDPVYINNNDVLHVKCSFRLGAFGFLSLNDIQAPGNCGLKDVVMALKWVQQNIKNFGGDSSNVTLYGGSSGAVIVHFMMLSPMATGLFHKGILQSACALNNWSLTKNPTHDVIKLAKHLGLQTTCLMELVEELRAMPAELLANASEELGRATLELGHIDCVFKPCIEVDFEGQPAFLTKSPLCILQSGKFNKVPMIVGSNYIEGKIMEYLNENCYEDFENMISNYDASHLVPRALAGEVNLTKAIGNRLLQFYVGEDNLKGNTKTQYLQIISDYYFLYYVNKTVRLHAQYAPEKPLFYYLLISNGDWALPDYFKYIHSCGHSAEIPLLYRFCTRETLETQNDNNYYVKGSRDAITIRTRVVKMWTNFAKFGNPTPDEDDPTLPITWDPVENENKLNYLCIGPELMKGSNPFLERMRFWDELHKEYTFHRALVHFNDIGIQW